MRKLTYKLFNLKFVAVHNGHINYSFEEMLTIKIAPHQILVIAKLFSKSLTSGYFENTHNLCYFKWHDLYIIEIFNSFINVKLTLINKYLLLDAPFKKK